MTETVGQAIPRSSVQDLFGVTEKERFEAELEFVQGLASPQYLNWLAQNRYFEDPALVEYLSYLQYWKQPEYARFLQYPHCLHFLDLLQSKEFRLNMASNHAKDQIHAQQLYFYQHYRSNRLKQQKPSSSK